MSRPDDDLPPGDHRLNGWMFINQKEPGEVQIFYPFTAEDLAAYKSLMIDDCSEFMTTCKCRDACVLELVALDNHYLALDHHHLIICDALASHESNQFQRSLRRLLSLFSPSSKRPCRRPTLFNVNVELRHDFEARGRRAGGARAPITPAAGPAPLHAAGSLHRRARGRPRL